MKQPASASHRVVMNTGILYAKMGITMFISLYTTRLILKALGASDFGIFNIVGGAIAMLGFLNAAMASATQRFMSYSEGAGDKEKQKSIFNISIVLHFGIALLLGIVLLIAGYFFFNGILNIPAERMHAARMVYYFMIVSTMLTVMTVPYDAVLNAHENMLYYAIVGIIESVLKLAVALIVVYTLSDKLIIYGLLMACISLFVMIIMRVYCHRKYEECVFAPKKYYDKGLMKEMTGFAGWNFLSSTSGVIANYGQGIVLNMFFGTIVNAAQGISSQINGQLSVFSRTLLKALTPIIVKSEGAGNRSNMLNASMLGSKISFFLLMFFCIPVLIEMPLIFKWWLKDIPEYTVLFCRLLLVRTLLEQLFVTLVTSIFAEGNIKKYQIYASILLLILLPVTCFLFAWSFPAYSIHIVFIVYTLISSALIVYFVNKNCGLSVKLLLKKVILPAFGSFIFVFIFSAIPLLFLNDGLLRFMMVVGVSVLSFIIIVWYMGFSVEERKSIGQPILSMVNQLKLRTVR
jgi:O-antigen/teichoic acid export membrane protein